MTSIPLNLRSSIAIEDAVRHARDAAGANTTVLSYFDRKENRSVPEVRCLTKGEEGPRLFAEAQGADYRVTVNDGEYELFLKSLPEDVVEPDAHHEARLSLYDGRHEEEFQSFIGG
jgi:hypothetical protein